jgi:hypothetical protein
MPPISPTNQSLSDLTPMHSRHAIEPHVSETISRRAVSTRIARSRPWPVKLLRASAVVLIVLTTWLVLQLAIGGEGGHGEGGLNLSPVTTTK